MVLMKHFCRLLWISVPGEHLRVDQSAVVVPVSADSSGARARIPGDLHIDICVCVPTAVRFMGDVITRFRTTAIARSVRASGLTPMVVVYFVLEVVEFGK